MSEPYSQPQFKCDICGDYFTADEMIEDEGFKYCKPCYAIQEED